VLPYRDGHLCTKGEIVVCADGSVRVESDFGDRPSGALSVEDSLVLARAIIGRALPGYAIVSKGNIGEIISEMNEWVEQPEDGRDG
jgi:hypothetical protein